MDGPRMVGGQATHGAEVTRNDWIGRFDSYTQELESTRKNHNLALVYLGAKNG